MISDVPQLAQLGVQPPDKRAGGSVRHLLLSKGIVAANLGAALGYVIWRSAREEARQAALLTLSEYTARFETYREHLIDQGKESMLFYAVMVAALAVAAAGLYELLSRAVALLLTRTRIGRAIAPWSSEAGRWGAS